jgi:hypothetical protein
MPAPKGNQNARGNHGGRPVKYKPEFVAQAKKACEAGFTDRELAELFGVSKARSTNGSSSTASFRTHWPAKPQPTTALNAVCTSGLWATTTTLKKSSPTDIAPRSLSTSRPTPPRPCSG